MIKKISPYFCILLILAAVLPYIAGIHGELLFDDVPLIKDDPFYLEEANPFQCWNRSFWKIERTQGLYRPLTLFTYWVDIRLYSMFSDKNTGLFEPGFRITNLFLHLLVTLLVFKLAIRLRFGRITAFIAALIYALHPIHVEAVTPAFGRGELLCALFLLAGLILHTYRQKSFFYVLGAAFCYMLSFMSKENGSAFLPVCILMELYMMPFKIPFIKYNMNKLYKGNRVRKGVPSESLLCSKNMNEEQPGTVVLQRNLLDEEQPGTVVLQRNSLDEEQPGTVVLQRKTLLLPFGVYGLVAFGVFCLRHAVFGTWLPSKQHFMPIIDNVIALSSPILRVVAATRIQGIALVKFFWPSVLSYDYSYARIVPSETIFDPYAWLTLLSFIAVPGILIYFKPRYTKKILFLCLAYIVVILPAGNFIVPAGTIFAERLQYLPSVFLCIFTAGVFVRLAQKIPFKAVVLIILVLSCALFVRTFTRTFVWENEMVLCISGTKSAPESIKVWNNISVQLSNVDDFKGAIIASTKTIEIYPNYATGYANRGLYFGRMGMYKKAKTDLRKALKISMNHLQANYTLGMIYANEGYPLKAKLVWERIQKHYPRDPRLKDALKLVNEGRWKEKPNSDN